MLLTTLQALLIASAQAGPALYWAPALHEALPSVAGSGRRVAAGFDGQVLSGLDIKINEIAPLAAAGVKDLDGLKRRRQDGVLGQARLSSERLAALERSLELLAPVIGRLEARGLRLDSRGRPSAALGAPLSLALADEARQTEIAAWDLAGRYHAGDRTLEQALADSKLADRLLADGYPFLTDEALASLAAIYEPGRTELLASRLAEGSSLALLSPEERRTMRDAVSAKKKKTRR